jgi:hypothetical protein
MKPILPILLTLLISVHTNAQDWKRTMNWYFGDSAGLSFATDPPTVLTDGAMYAGEGCATISDTNGNLLFYTNGITVWNWNHQVMDNGTGLNGHISSTQSSLIVPWPGNDSLYYIFTTDAVGQWKGLQYSLVNIKENAGQGKVIIKNILLKTPVSEKLAATKHLNGRDYWILTRGYSNNNFYSYLITNNGIVDCPVTTAIGAMASSPSDAQGEIEFSLDGTKLIEAVYNLSYNRIDIFSFDRERGIPHNQINIPNIILPFSVELSQDAKYLYVTNRLNYIYQYDLTKPTGSDIRNTQYEIYFSGNTTNNYHRIIQRGIDNKLYVAIYDSVYLSVINNPEKSEDSCGFVLSGISLVNKGQFGLPNFISSHFYHPVLDFKYETDCGHDTTRFMAWPESVISPFWNIYKNSVLLHSNIQSSFSYHFPDTGKYSVRLIANGDTVIKEIYIEPDLDLGKDTIACNQASIRLNLPSNLRCITWQDGSDSLNYTIAQSGSYHVSAYNIKGCQVSDTINVLFSSIPTPQISRTGDRLETDSNDYSYQWFYNNNPIDSNKYYLIARNTGEYKVKITDSLGCTAISSSFNVNSLSIQPTENVQFKVYPNPSKSGKEIIIESEGLIQSIRVFDVSGKEVFSEQNINDYQYHLKATQKGLYILNINGTANYKLMIE